MPQAVGALAVSALGITAGTTAALVVSGVVQLATGLVLSSVLSGASRSRGALPGSLSSNLTGGGSSKEGVEGVDGQILFTDEVGQRKKLYGRGKFGGQIVFGRAQNGYLYRIIAHGQGPISRVVELRLDDRQRTLEADGKVLSAPYNHGDNGSLIRIETRLGDVPSLAYDGPTAVSSEWGGSHRLDGVWTTFIRIQQRAAADQQASYPSGATALQWIAETSLLYDPRFGQAVYTDNAALVIADWIAGPEGFNLGYDAIDTGDLIAAASASDVLRALSTGGTSRFWRLAGSALMGDEPEAALLQMRDACGGDIRLKPNGKIGISVGGDPAPVITLTDDDVIGFLEIDDGTDALDRYTELPFSYVDEQLDYTKTTGETWINQIEEDRLGGSEPGRSLDASWSPYHAQARHAAKIMSIRENPGSRARIQFGISALPAIYERTVTLDIKSLGLSGSWRVEPYTLSAADMTITLDLARISEDQRQWSVTEEGAPQTLPAVQDDATLPPAAPTGVQAFGQGSPSGNPGVYVAYDAPASEDTTHYVAYKEASASDWISAPNGSTDTFVHILDLADGTLYDIAVIASRSQSYDPDDETVTDVRVTGVAARSDIPVPDVPTGLAAIDIGGGQAQITLTASASTYGRATEIRRDGVLVYSEQTVPGQAVTFIDQPGAGPFTWAARAVSLSGVQSIDTTTSATIA